MIHRNQWKPSYPQSLWKSFRILGKNGLFRAGATRSLKIYAITEDGIILRQSALTPQNSGML